MSAHAPSIVLICWAAVALALGNALAPVWLAGLAFASVLQARSLYRRHRR